MELARVKSSPLPHAVGEEALPAVARSNSEGSAARVRADLRWWGNCERRPHSALVLVVR